MKPGFKKRIYHLAGKAIGDWGMIRKNERILVGLSGGQDSQALMNILSGLKKKAPIHFDIFPVYVDAGFEPSFAPELEQFVNTAYGDLRVEHTDFGLIAHSGKNRENPCYVCSRLRRKRLFELAEKYNCRKIALGHNKDDIIETLFINMFYAGKIAAMKPRQSFFSGRLDIIRPLSYVEKKEISLFCKMADLPEFKNTCPSANSTKRSEIREMLEGMYAHNKNIKGNIFRSMSNIASEYLLDHKLDKTNDRHPKST